MPKNIANTTSYGNYTTSFNININGSGQLTTPKAEPQKPQVATKIYGKAWIVIQNKLVHAISSLSVNERRLILFLSPIVRTTVDKDPAAKVFIVNANEFAKMFGLNNNSYYETVREAAKSLQSKSFVFWEFHKNAKTELESSVSWIGKSTYIPQSSIIEVTLMDDIITMLSVFDRNNPYTRYQKNLIVNLSANGLLLLELVASFEDKRNKEETYTVEYMREKFDCVDIYENIAEFKRKVLNPAVIELNKHTPYIVKCVSQANAGGKTVTHYKFSVQKENLVPLVSTSNKSTPKKVYKKGLTEKQIAKLAIHKNQFVSVNNHMIQDKAHDVYQVFESFKPLLSDKATVNEFNHIDDFLSVAKGAAAPNLSSKSTVKDEKSEKATKAAKEELKRFEPTADEIKKIAANPHFQYDYPSKEYDTGSDEHISYLEFRLGSNLGEFTKKPLQLYLK